MGEATLVAQPAPVDLGVVAREDAQHLAFACRGGHVAAHRAEPAHRGHVLDLPGPPSEAVLRRGERADGAQLDDVARERRRVGVVREGGDLGERAAVARHQLIVLGHVRGEPRAAVAEDAALAVERDQRRDRDRLLEGQLGERHPGGAGAVPERQVLQRALAALVADRAVEWVVDEDELERGVLSLRCLGGRRRRPHHHPVLCGERAARLQLREPLHLDQAHAAGADRRPEPRLVAEDRDLDPRGGGRLDEAGALRHLHLAAVDRQCDLGAHAITPSGRSIRPTPWEWMWRSWTVTGARIPSSEDAPSNGQPPPSIWAWNSSRNLAT